MLNRSTLLLLAVFSGANVCHARLGESEEQSAARYGTPVPSVKNELAPLLRGAVNHTYHFEGWKIRAAFLNGQCVRLEYAKRLGQNQNMLISDIEQKAILDSEKGEGSWRKQERRFSDYTASRLDRTGSGRTRYDVWINTNGTRASFRLGRSILRLEMREALEQEKQAEKEADKKPANEEESELPDF